MKRALRRIQEFLHTLVGMPSYQSYVLHQARYHPEAPILSEKEFFIQAQKDKYSADKGRCC